MCCKYQALCFFLQITFPNPSPCLLTSDFFCSSCKFTMELFIFPLFVSFFLFLFLSYKYRSFYCGKILSFLGNLNNLSSDLSKYRERFCSSVSTQESLSNFHSCNVQSLSVTLWVVHSIHHHYLSCLPVHNFQFIFCPF